MVFGAYRRDEFADPDNFLLQLGMVLERYSDDVIRDVTSPQTGIQRRVKFPPSIAEVVEACDAEVARRARLERYAQMHATPRAPRLDLVQTPGRRANVFVPASNALYPALCDRAGRPDADAADYRFDQQHGGIWVGFGWIDNEKGQSAARYQRLTADELRAMYARQPAAQP